DTAKAVIVEGLIWTALAAAALQRFLASMTQLLAAVPRSTRKVAMCAVHVLGNIARALQSGDVRGLYAALEAAVTYLACHAQRAHPKRDRHLGRSQLGLEPLLRSHDGNRSGCENFRLVVTSLSAVPCRHGNTGGIIIRSMGADPTRSAGLYSGA